MNINESKKLCSLSVSIWCKAMSSFIVGLAVLLYHISTNNFDFAELLSCSLLIKIVRLSWHPIINHIIYIHLYKSVLAYTTVFMLHLLTYVYYTLLTFISHNWRWVRAHIKKKILVGRSQMFFMLSDIRWL